MLRTLLHSLFWAPTKGPPVEPDDRPAAWPEQPVPLYTMTVRHRDPAQDDETVIIRLWRPGDAQRCLLCRACDARRVRTGQSLCCVVAPARVAVDRAPLFQLPD